MILKLIIQIYDIKSNQIGTSACNNNFYNSIYLKIQHYHNRLFSKPRKLQYDFCMHPSIIISLMTQSKNHDICQCADK